MWDITTAIERASKTPGINILIFNYFLGKTEFLLFPFLLLSQRQSNEACLWNNTFWKLQTGVGGGEISSFLSKQFSLCSLKSERPQQALLSRKYSKLYYDHLTDDRYFDNLGKHPSAT